MRPIDADAVCERCRKSGAICTGSDCEIPTMPTLTPPNEPLTLDEMREMDGEPVYIVFSPDVDGEKLQFWALVVVDEWDDVYLANKDEWAFNYEEFLEDVEAIYRRPPEGEEDT